METVSRKELRAKSSELLNGLPKAVLLKEFGISRISEISGLDCIGLPVYNAIRPLSSSISIHSGKGLDKFASRAGAIAEAIEYEVSLNPKGKFLIGRALEIPFEERMEIADCFPIRSSVVSDLTPLAWEELTNVQTGEQKWVPSELVWMKGRLTDQPLSYFQASTNGLASGATLEDAILSGLYEVIERDAWTNNQFLLDNYGVSPVRVPLIALPNAIETCVRKIEATGSKLHLFDVTTDYGVPVFCAVILDLSGSVAGTFSGYGCHLNAETAIIRAVCEAAQSRCCYIGGARDDMFRRQFLIMKRLDQEKLDQMFSELQTTNPISEYRAIEFPDVKSELRYLLRLVRQQGVAEVYSKELGSVLDGAIRVARVFSPQCEPHRFDQWTPGLRCLSYCHRYVQGLGERQKPQPDVEEGEEWKQA